MPLDLQGRITTSCVVDDMPMKLYRRQPCDAPSLSSSDAVVLVESTPMHLRAAWDAEDDHPSTEADIGTVIHALLLEPHRAQRLVVTIEANDWRTNAAKEQRDFARSEGKVPLLARDHRRAMAAVRAVQAHPVASQLLKDGKSETSWFARDKSGIYLKARPDHFTPDRVIVDIKTVGSAHPDFLKRRLYDGRWFQQAPWHCDVVERVEKKPAKGYCWLIVEQKPPHAVVVRRPPDRVLMHGHRLNQEAQKTFARCATEDRWPAYGLELEELDLPDYAYYRLEQEAAETPPPDMRAVALARELGADPFI